MWTGLCGQRAVGFWVTEPKARYRRNYDHDGAETITRKAEDRVTQERPECLAEVLRLARSLQAVLRDEPEGMALWLDLEEALHRYWLEVAAAHYDLGCGLGASSGDSSTSYVKSVRGTPRERVLVLMQALRDLADDMPEHWPGSGMD